MIKGGEGILECFDTSKGHVVMMADYNIPGRGVRLLGSGS
jgi:hypothetical protein